jgi:signal transduction histidine kinase
LIGILYTTDTLYESVWGRNMVALAMPIFIASVILPPPSSFVIAGIVSASSLFIASKESFDPNIIGAAAYLAIAFVSWLSARSLERAVQELRLINRELDQRVFERTAQLKETNVQLEQEIEARKRASDALVVARDRALEASRLKSQLLANVSHELRTPLGAILGFAEMLKGGYYGPVSEKQGDTITKIIETNQDLTQLVGELLDQAQLEAGKLKLQAVLFQPKDMVEGVENRLQVLARENGLTLTCEIDPALPPKLVGDPARLQQILLNLGGNAIKFTPSGTVSISLYPENEYEWAMAVKDEGIGIPQKAQAYIFEPFRQVDGSITRIHEGSGLGLSIVKQLTTQMKGRIQLESEQGKGSLFTVYLPLRTSIKEKQS